MRTMNWKAIITAVFCVFLTTACSKKLMPPGIETSESTSEITELVAPPSSESDADMGPSIDNGNPFAENSAPESGQESRFAGNSAPESGQESRLQAFEVSKHLKDIHFKFDRYDLDENSKAILKKNADFLKSNPGFRVEIQGHCDERGTNNYNIALGERRAHSTKKYLVSQGVDSSNLHVISYGEEKPFCFSSDKICWSKNRRAHFKVSK